MKRAPLGTAMTDPLTAVLKRTPPMTSSDHCWTVQLLPDEPPMALQVPIFVPFLVAAQELIGGWMERVRPLGLTLANPHPALQSAQGGTTPAAFAKVLVGIYNTRRRTARLPEWVWTR